MRKNKSKEDLISGFITAILTAALLGVSYFFLLRNTEINISVNIEDPCTPSTIAGE